nr:family 16 glycosylhydrolase [Streptomyces silvisoli]
MTDTPRAYSMGRGRTERCEGNWSPGAVTFSVDGHAYETRTPADTHGIKWVFDHPIHLIMNLAVGGYWPGDPNGNTQFRSP